MANTPENYQRLDGSERRPALLATLIGPADIHEDVVVTIVLRRRLDGPPLPDYKSFLVTPHAHRQRLPLDEFAAQYGASPTETTKVTDFITSHSLAVVETSAARRTVVASGTVAQMSAAFAVNLSYYQRDVVHRAGNSQNETYRGRDGFVFVPKELVEIIIGVFGLDNRSITKRNSPDPPGTGAVMVPDVTSLYNFPTKSAAGQTIGIASYASYYEADNTTYWQKLQGTGYISPLPTITNVPPNGNSGIADSETNQDIRIAFSAAPGASIVVYFTIDTQKGWVDLVGK